MIDNKTSRLQLPLPNVENYLEDDVARLSEALTTLDTVVATLAEDGKLMQDQVPDYVPRLDTDGKLPSDNLPVTAVQTDGEGKIPESVIPEAIARDAEVLSRNGNLSELADRAAAWLNVRPIGSTPLAADPVNPLDATTRQWVEARRSVDDSWAVVHTDAVTPSVGTLVTGGKVESQYKNPTLTRYARLYASSYMGGYSFAGIEAQGADSHKFNFYENGHLDFKQPGHNNAIDMYSVTTTWAPLISAGVKDLRTGGVDRTLETTTSDLVLLGYSLGAARPSGHPTKVGFHQYIPGSLAFGSAVITVGGDNNNWSRYFFDIAGQIYGSTNNGDFSYTRNGISDSRVKHAIAPTTPDKAWSNLASLQFFTFVYNSDEQNRTRRGVIAQQAEAVDSLYVKTRVYPGAHTGDVPVEQKELDTTPMLLDTMHVVQVLMQKIEAMEAEIAELKASK